MSDKQPRRQSISLTVLRQRYEQDLNTLEVTIDNCDAVTDEQCDESAIRDLARKLRTLKNSYSISLCALTDCLTKCGHTNEVNELKNSRVNIMKLYHATMTHLSGFCDQPLTVSDAGSVAAWAAKQDPNQPVSDDEGAASARPDAAQHTAAHLQHAIDGTSRQVGFGHDNADVPTGWGSHDPGPRARPNYALPTHRETTQSVAANATAGWRRDSDSSTSSSRSSGLAAVLKMLAARDLPNIGCDKFNGGPANYVLWRRRVSMRISELEMTDFQAIQFLADVTVGEPKRVVLTYATHSTDDSANLRKIQDELDYRFGCSTAIYNDCIRQIESFPAISGRKVAERMRELSDLCERVDGFLGEVPDLSILNTASGLSVLLSKLPSYLTDRWRRHRYQYGAKTNAVVNAHPPFRVFCAFVKEASREASVIESDSACEQTARHAAERREPRARTALLTAHREQDTARDRANKTLVHKGDISGHSSFTCPLHRTDGHALVDCKKFMGQAPSQRKSVLFQHGRCFRCFGPHRVASCTSNMTCSSCSSDKHHTLLHWKAVVVDKSSVQPESTVVSNVTQSDKSSSNLDRDEVVRTLATGSSFANIGFKSCGRTIPVQISYLSNSVNCFAIIDDQSTSSFVTPELCRLLDCPDSGQVKYSLTTLDTFSVSKHGRICKGLRISPIGDTSVVFDLPAVITNDSIPDTSSDFASSDLVESIPSVSSYAKHFPPDQGKLAVQALIGRDAASLMHAKFHTTDPPLVVETPLGWALVGPVLDGSYESKLSTFSYCCLSDHFRALPEPARFQKSIIDSNVGDDKPGLSQEDRKFLEAMDRARVSETGHIQLPLPRRSPEIELPNNKFAVQRRMRSTLASLARSPAKLSDCTNFVQKMIDKKHIEQVPPSEIDKPAFFVPAFPVTHPKKKKTRIVFDSAAAFDGVSLNSILLQGPDQTNSLLVVLLRFRLGNIAVAADIESMFHCFLVEPHDRDLMRFFWYANNDTNSPITQYRARVHIFGNCSSPAVANYGLRFAASFASDDELSAKNFITDCFYVDDGLLATHSVSEAVTTVTRTCELLSRFNIRLHKIISNSAEVLDKFPVSELAAEKSELLTNQTDQRALGVRWDLQSDNLSIVSPNVSLKLTKRGIVALCNSIFDPLGIASPVVLGIRLLFRDIIDQCRTFGWDDPLPDSFRSAVEHYVSQLHTVSSLSIPRSVLPFGVSEVSSLTLHVFSDASMDALGFVAYLVSKSRDGHVIVRFVLAGNKVAPRAACTVPRMELCAAVAAVRACQTVHESLQFSIDRTQFYTDSRVVLGYIANTKRRFQRYVSNRVNAILRGSAISDWKYVPTDENPADIASRPHSATALCESRWRSGPDFLKNINSEDYDFQPVEADSLPELVRERPVLSSSVQEIQPEPFHELFRLSRWNVAVGTMITILTFTQHLLFSVFSMPTQSRATLRERAIRLLLTSAQRCINLTKLPTAWRKLTPFVEDGLVRAKGRIGRAPVEFGFRHPVILDGQHRISTLLVDYFHQRTGHQGRRITAAALRDGGYLIIGAARLIRFRLSKCYSCRLLRALPSPQFMADLPVDRLEARPPFESCGMDCFGPYQIPLRVTRRSPSSSKIWLLLFCCLYSRAVHIEVLLSMSTEAFINAFRRFVSLRGACKRVRCDKGTNFVGAANLFNELTIANQLERQYNVDFAFNPPGASHFGGVFESKIRSVRRVLDQTIAIASGRLTFDEFVTLVAEAASVVNSTPYIDVVDSEIQPLSPSVLLFAKRFDNAPPLLEPTEADLSAYGTRRWRRVQFLAHSFWVRWRSEFLANLTARSKWLRPTRNLCVGDIVLLLEKNAPRCNWPLARVVEAQRANDGLVRRVTVVTATGRKLERASASLILVTANSENTAKA